MVDQIEVLKMIRHLSANLPHDASQNMLRHLLMAVHEIANEAIFKTETRKFDPPKPVVQPVTEPSPTPEVRQEELKLDHAEKPNLKIDPTMLGYNGHVRYRDQVYKILKAHNTTMVDVKSWSRNEGVTMARMEIAQYLSSKGLNNREVGLVIDRSPWGVGALLQKAEKKLAAKKVEWAI